MWMGLLRTARTDDWETVCTGETMEVCSAKLIQIAHERGLKQTWQRLMRWRN